MPEKGLHSSGGALAEPAGRAEVLASVREAALAITSELSVDELLQKLVNTARELVNAHYAAVGVVSDEPQKLERFVVAGVSPPEIARIGNWPRGHGLLGLLLKDPRPYRAASIAADPNSVGFPPNHPPMSSFLGVPIQIRGRVLGTFYLTNKIGAAEFSQSDEDLVVLFAAHAAVAIENARLFTRTDTELQRTLVEVRRAERRSRFLAELTTLLLPGRSGADAAPLPQIARRISEILGDACCISVLEHDYPRRGRRSEVHHDDPARAEAARRALERAWSAIEAEVIEKRHAIFVSGGRIAAGTEPAVNPALLAEEHFSALLVLPVGTRRGIYAVLAIMATQPNEFSTEDLFFASSISERLAVSFENWTLLDSLSSALAAREQFIAVAAHELKTPVTVLRGFAEVLQKGPPDGALQRRALSAILRNADRLGALTNELLDVVRMQTGRLALHLERANLASIVEEVVQRFETQLEQPERRRLEVRRQADELYGQWDVSRLDQVFTNLISNAVKFSPAGGVVTVSLERRNGAALISVADQGIGIPEKSRGRIFEPFFRAENAQQVKAEGSGLGLHISRQIVERLGGQIWFDTDEKRGTTFRVSLPLTSG